MHISALSLSTDSSGDSLDIDLCRNTLYYSKFSSVKICVAKKTLKY